MTKWYTVEWTRKTLTGLCYSDRKSYDIEEEANALIEELKDKEDVIEIWKTTIERIQ